MKKITLYLLLFLTAAGFSACNYLDIVPDERDKEEDAYKDVQAAERFLYSCYSFMPNPNNATGSLDFMTGDEVTTAFENESFASFPQGVFTASNTVISYWNTLFNGIRQCYKLMNNLDKVPGLPENTKTQYVGELKFLIAYYHMLLVRCYGPCIIVREEVPINTAPSDYAARSPLAECIQFITDTFDEAAEILPDTQSPQNTGRGTRIAALSLKAYILMYYASPLLNGNSELAGQLINNDGTALMSPDYDATRWATARDAYKAAIDAARAAGHTLYTEDAGRVSNPCPENDRLRLLRTNLLTPPAYNKEVIWSKVFNEGIYGLQKKSAPGSNQNYNGVGPTMNMLRRFYTNNGLPWNVDPTTKDLNEFESIPLNSVNTVATFADSTTAVIAMAGRQTSQMNLHREPRYYAWISFHNGFYEITNDANNPGYQAAYYQRNGNGGQVITDFRYSSPFGYGRAERNHSLTGTLNKKGVHPDNTARGNDASYTQYTWPVIRLSELYLGYAECCAESGDAATAKAYIDPIRTRAGIPTVDESWGRVGITPNANQMVDIVRQERQIEMYLECQNFWDMRRWLLAEAYFNLEGKGDGIHRNYTGFNVFGNTDAEFSAEINIPGIRRSFEHFHYLLPIPSQDTYNNHNAIQNPGY